MDLPRKHYNPNPICYLYRATVISHFREHPLSLCKPILNSIQNNGDNTILSYIPPTTPIARNIKEIEKGMKEDQSTSKY